MTRPETDITRLLEQAGAGDADAQSRLMARVYPELRRQAAGRMRREPEGHTLQATALVNEAYLKLIAPGGVAFQNRAHFFAAAAQAMRRILIDHARLVHADRRNGSRLRVTFDSAQLFSEVEPAELLALDQALDRLQKWAPRPCRVVEMRFFAGLSEEEIATVLKISARTVKRDWTMARAWLHSEILGQNARR